MRTETSKKMARRMRHEPTDAERCLWNLLRSRQLGAYKFRRQFPVASYIADFACISHRLIIEADGGHHVESVYDKQRTEDLAKGGWLVLRFWNNDILENGDGVLMVILDALSKRPKPAGYVPDVLELAEE